MFNSSNKRSIYLIDKSFQLNFIARFIVLIVCCAIISGALLAVYYYVKYDMVINEGQEILLRYIKPDQKPAEKIQLPVNSVTATVNNNNYTVLNGDLYFVKNKIAFKTYSVQKYRIAGQKLEVFSVVQNKFRPVGRLNYATQKGQLGIMMLSKGKQIFVPVIQPAGKRINPKNIQGATDRFEIVFFALIVSTLIFIIISIIFGIFFSHRLAGPIYRLGLSIDRIASGDLDFQVKLRRTDSFQHIAAKLNTLIKSLKK